MAAGFIVLLLATELVLSLPDESASAPTVAQFYAEHRAFIIVLQVVGFVAAGLLGAYAWRLRTVDRVVAGAGLLVAVCALAPGLITLVLAVVADPANPGPASRWNALEPRGDDISVRRHCRVRGGGRCSAGYGTCRCWASWLAWWRSRAWLG